MVKVCDSCRRYAAAGRTTCPACGSGLRSVSVSSTGIRSRPGEQPSPLGNGLVLAGIGLLALVFLLGVVWLAGSGEWEEPGAGKRADSTGRIRVGMHISEVGRILDHGPPPSPSYPRLRDWFPADEFGNGTIDYEGDNVALKIHFERGRVTSVEESPSAAGPGFHRSRLIVRER